MPLAVRDELSASAAPLPVRNWIGNPPAWLEVRSATQLIDDSLAELGAAESAAITLAIEFHADLLLMDDRRGVKAALNKGFRVAGTLGILGMAARHDLLNLAGAFDRLKRTSFHHRQEILDQFLSEQGGNRVILVSEWKLNQLPSGPLPQSSSPSISSLARAST